MRVAARMVTGTRLAEWESPERKDINDVNPFTNLRRLRRSFLTIPQPGQNRPTLTPLRVSPPPTRRRAGGNRSRPRRKMAPKSFYSLPALLAHRHMITF